MRQLRIITKMVNPSLGINPQQILEEGSRKVSFKGKHRVYLIRYIEMDENNKPIHSIPRLGELSYFDTEAIKEDTLYPLIKDYQVLNQDKRLMPYNN